MNFEVLILGHKMSSEYKPPEYKPPKNKIKGEFQVQLLNPPKTGTYIGAGDEKTWGGGDDLAQI